MAEAFCASRKNITAKFDFFLFPSLPRFPPPSPPPASRRQLWIEMADNKVSPLHYQGLHCYTAAPSIINTENFSAGWIMDVTTCYL